MGLVASREGHVCNVGEWLRVTLGRVSDKLNQRVPKLVEREAVLLTVLPRHAIHGNANLVPAQADARPNGEVSEVEGATDGHCLPAVVSRERDSDAAPISGLAQEVLVQLDNAVQVSGLFLQVHGATASRGIRRKSSSRGPSA